MTLVAEHHRLDQPKARVLLVHGFGEHRLRYRPLAGDLLANGYECHSFDLRGHGASGGARGHVDRFDDYLGDLAQLAAAVAAAPDDGRRPALVLFGHSLGGLVAVSAIVHRVFEFDGLALSSPYLRSALRAPAGVETMVRIAARFLPRLRIKAPLSPDDLSSDLAVVEAYQSDPDIVRTLTLSWLAEVLRAQDEVLERAAEVTLPCLVQIGTADTIADPERTRQIFQHLGSRDKDLQDYAGFRHEVFNELDRERVVADLVSWLDHRFGGVATGSRPPRAEG